MNLQPDAQRELDLFAGFCRDALTIEDGTPLSLHDFQRRMLTDLFDGVRETLILIPKKNGKSTLLAALALYHLCTTPDAECVIAAASRDQAAIMLRQAQGFIRRSPSLKDRLNVKQREVVHSKLSGRVRILASDADTADGVIPTLALVDELHRHKDDGEMYGVFRDGLGPRDGKMVTISTAGDDPESPLGTMRNSALSQPGIERDGAYRYIRTAEMAMHEWALDPEDDIEDLEVVKQANPAPWQTVEELKGRRDSPSMRPWQWKRFACGIWSFGEESAISDKEWAACAKEGVRIPTDAPRPFIGIDIGRRVDCTAVAPVWRADGSETVILHPPIILYPPGDGMPIPEDDIWEAISEFAQVWPDAVFVADPSLGGDIFLERIEREFPRAETAIFEQVPHPLARMAQQFTELLAAGKIEHPDDPALNAHILAATSRPVGEGWRFIPRKKPRRPIDAVIAAGMAVSTLLGNSDKPTYASAAWQGGEAPTAKKVPKSEYVPCRNCQKPIHPSLHEPGAVEKGLCVKCR